MENADRERYARAIRVGDLVSEVKQLAAKAQARWSSEVERLEEGRTELGVYLELFCTDLSNSPVFSKMPRLAGRCEYLWAAFLQDGAPGSPEWDEGWDEESALHGLSVAELFVVLASIEAESALFLLLQHAEAHGRQDMTEASVLLEAISRCVESGMRALSFVDKHMPGKEKNDSQMLEPA